MSLSKNKHEILQVRIVSFPVAFKRAKLRILCPYDLIHYTESYLSRSTQESGLAKKRRTNEERKNAHEFFE